MGWVCKVIFVSHPNTVEIAMFSSCGFDNFWTMSEKGGGGIKKRNIPISGGSLYFSEMISRPLIGLISILEEICSFKGSSKW